MGAEGGGVHEDDCGGGEMTHLSLFSGIGGLDLAAEMAGFRTIGQVEIDDYCNRVLEYHWPDVPRWRDIRDVTKESVRKAGVGAITVISGGFPCQPFSQAGRRGGTKDDRYLWPEMLRVIDELRPAWVIAENVNGIVSMELEILSVAVEGRTIGRFKDYDFYRAVYTRQEVMLLGTICQELEAKGYEVQPLAIPACAVEAPHERRRVFIVGYAGSCGLSGESRRGAGQEFTDGYTQSQAGDVADAPQHLLNRPRQTGPAGRGEFADVSNVADPDIMHREQCRSPGRMGRERKPDQGDERGQRPTQPRLGGFADGLPSGLAGHRWPAGWWPTPQAGKNTPNATDTEDIVNADGTPWTPGQKPHDRRTGKPVTTALADAVRWPAGPGEQHEWEPPRIATGVRDRVAKLRALGNAVVPAQAYPIFRAIAEIVKC